jgi:hypothetical protein
LGEITKSRKLKGGSIMEAIFAAFLTFTLLFTLRVIVNFTRGRKHGWPLMKQNAYEFDFKALFITALIGSILIFHGGEHYFWWGVAALAFQFLRPLFWNHLKPPDLPRIEY